MRRTTWMTALVLALGATGVQAETAPAAKPTPKASKPDTGTKPSTTEGTGTSAGPETEDQKTIYALGLSVGKDLSLFALTPAEVEVLHRGMQDGLNGVTPAVKLEDYAPKIQALAKSRQAQVNANYLERAAKEPGATKLPSGVIYREVKAGQGKTPRATDTVKVHYRGTLVDGTEFDSSYGRGLPVEFPLNGVIPCWTQGVQKMKVGGKAKLTCPGSTAYGERPPQGSRIPPNAVLVFDVELVDIPGDTSQSK
ncbi:FKBP-type peptidyl-prolyl cis-trans isomerase [Citreicoccus inhibens]|uniref:FKBP-type peptidyl-prolyl cis-trans isomerase n=1 Tax=Citreicoccus inhibens TaxID=2849499 RepID=UPI001EEF88BD|nr:FKBP-type peptidyl-prolyl cis-trans isomerase [Citreicoccus inhibens]